MAKRAAAVDRDPWLLEFGAAIFSRPDRLVQSHWHRFKGPISIPAHVHADLLQLDLNIGMAGTIAMEGRTVPISGICAAAFYPGERHEIELRPETADSEVYSIKIRVPARLSVVRRRLFPSVLKLVVANHRLVQSLRQLNRLAADPGSRASLACATLADILCHWPLDGGDVEQALPGDIPEAVHGGMRKALGEIDRRLGAPPSLAELARTAHLSPRHFTRQFRVLFGCPPHAYIQARRLVQAKESLVSGSLNVTEIADDLGFPSIHPFSRWFRKSTGVSPTTYRRTHSFL